MMAGALGYIDDGYTERGFIAEVRGIHPALRFEYRPMLIAERAEYLKATDTLKSLVEQRKYVALSIKDHLVSWDLRNSKGELVPNEVANILRMKQKLFDRLFLVICGEEAADPDPQAKQSDGVIDQEAEDIKEAVSRGKTVQEIREERDLKNSPRPSASS